MADGNIAIRWWDTEDQAEEYAQFFTRNVDLEYISHTEIQIGRASEFRVWSPDCQHRVQKELLQTLSDHTGKKRVAIAEMSNSLAALAIISIEWESMNYAVLEDFVVSRRLRRLGIGSSVLRWLCNELKHAGVQELFLESGVANVGAQEFFRANAFATCSVVMHLPLK